MEILGIEFSLFQLILIALLFVIAPLGYYNQKRMLKKKEEEENIIKSYNQKNSSTQEDDEESKQIINYINNYKGSYPKDTIKSALLNNGNTAEKVESLVEKYY